MKIDNREVSFSDIVFRPPDMIFRWCKMPYPGHKKGCPNQDDCVFFNPYLQNRLRNAFKIHILWVEFDLDEQEQRMRDKHPNWTARQCRNLLYWQQSVRKELKWWAEYLWPGYHLVMGAEGGGVDFYLTMKRQGVPLDTMRSLHIVRVIGIVYFNGMKPKTLMDY